jgi:hypothetical protein
VNGPDEEIVIANEFAAVAVRRITTRNGERLQIRSIERGRMIQLDAIALEALTWSSVLEVGRGLEMPFGPDHTVITAPKAGENQ